MLKAYRKFAAGPMGLFTTVMVFGTIVIGGWKWYVAPKVRRRRREENEAYAEHIFQEREKKWLEEEQRQ